MRVYLGEEKKRREKKRIERIVGRNVTLHLRTIRYRKLHMSSRKDIPRAVIGALNANKEEAVAARKLLWAY